MACYVSFELGELSFVLPDSWSPALATSNVNSDSVSGAFLARFRRMSALRREDQAKLTNCLGAHLARRDGCLIDMEGDGDGDESFKITRWRSEDRLCKLVSKSTERRENLNFARAEALRNR